MKLAPYKRKGRKFKSALKTEKESKRVNAILKESRI
jgi:hypothetical protein